MEAADAALAAAVTELAEVVRHALCFQKEGRGFQQKGYLSRPFLVLIWVFGEHKALFDEAKWTSLFARRPLATMKLVELSTGFLVLAAGGT